MEMKGAAMSELENIKPVAFYRADWKGDMMFRKDNTVVIRKNEGDFTTGWIKPLYDELPEPQLQLTIPKSIAERLDKEGSYDSAFVYPRTWELEVQGTLESCRRINVQKIYLISKALGVDLVKVV